MTGAAEAQEMFVLLQNMDQILANIQEKIMALNEDSGPTSVRETTVRLYQVERLAIRWLALGRRMGLPEDIGKAIDLIARLTVVIRMLHISYNLLMSTNPVFMAIGFAAAIGSLFTMIDAGEGYF